MNSNFSQPDGWQASAYFHEDWRPDPASPLPLHLQISACFSARISSGAWPPGMKLAPQRELCRLLGVNRSTLMTALGTLAGQGLIEGRRGGEPGLPPPAATVTAAQLPAAGRIIWKRAHTILICPLCRPSTGWNLSRG